MKYNVLGLILGFSLVGSLTMLTACGQVDESATDELATTETGTIDILMSGSTIDIEENIMIQPTLYGSYDMKPDSDIPLPEPHYQGLYKVDGIGVDFIVESLQQDFEDVSVIYNPSEKRVSVTASRPRGKRTAIVQQLDDTPARPDYPFDDYKYSEDHTLSKRHECANSLEAYTSENNTDIVNTIEDIYVEDTSDDNGLLKCQYIILGADGHSYRYVDMMRGDGFANEMGINSTIDSSSIRLISGE